MMNVISIALLAGLLAADGDELKFTGVVRDATGKPLAGARIDVDTAAPRVGRGIFCPSCYLDCRKTTTSDGDGRFVIAIRDRSLKFRLLGTMPGMRPQLTQLIEPEAGDVVLVLEPQPKNWPEKQIVHGRIVDDHDRPVSGAMVEPYGGKSSEKRWWGTVKVDPAVSDREGRFKLLLTDDLLGLDVRVRADGYSGTTTDLLAPGPQEHKIVIPTGTKVTGKVVHNGQPVSNLRVAVVQVERSAGHHFIQAVEDTTDEEGKFTFEYLPANQLYAIYTLIDGKPREYVLSTKRFGARADGQTRDLGSLEVTAAFQMSGHVMLPSGESLPPNSRLALGRDPAWDLVSVPVHSDGHFEFVGLPPETYEIRIAIGDFELNTSQLNYQATDERVFGIRVDQSVNDVVIPLRRPQNKN